MIADSKVQEPEFHKLFQNYLQESLNLLSKFHTNSKGGIGNDKNHEMWFLILHNLGHDQKLDSFLEIKKWLKKNPWFENHFNYHVGFGTISYPLELYDVLRRFVHDHYLESGLIPNTEYIDKMYTKFEKFLVSKTISYRINIYLSNFESNDIFVIEDGLEIHNLTKDQQYNYNKNLEHYDPHVNSLIVYAIEFPKLFKSDFDDSKENFQRQRRFTYKGVDLIESLRIFKHGHFGATKMVKYSSFVYDSKSKLSGFGIQEKKYSFMEGDKYILEKEEEKDFITFWKKYCAAKKPKAHSFLLRPIGRLMDIYQRDDLDDVVIDLMISLETLFTIGKTKQDDLIPMISKFLEPENSINRDKITEVLQLARELRNDIVHGGEQVDFFWKDGTKISFSEISKEFEKIVRRCLKKTVKLLSEKEFSKKQFIEYLNSI